MQVQACKRSFADSVCKVHALGVATVLLYQGMHAPQGRFVQTASRVRCKD